MDRLVHLFSSGTAIKMENLQKWGKVVRFDMSLSFDDIVCQVNSLFKLENEGMVLNFVLGLMPDREGLTMRWC